MMIKMVKQLSPCTKCTERHLACHDSCKVFKEWKDYFDADKQKYCEDVYRRKELQKVDANGYKNMRTRKASNKF